jgi:hypothetical protein
VTFIAKKFTIYPVRSTRTMINRKSETKNRKRD